MKILKTILLALLALILLGVAAAFVFVRNMSHSALPDYNENITLSSLHAPVEVYRDSFAIPHVYAQNEHDLYLAVGYLMAEDRLWQMDMLRHVTEGRLSEIFGEEYVDTDLLLRALRFRTKSEKILSLADTASMVLLNAFAEGVNQYLENNKGNLPPEFTILNYEPEKWEPVHTLNMIGYMAWDLKAGWSEILLDDISKIIDSVKYVQLLPDLAREQPMVYPGFERAASHQKALPDMLLNTMALQNLGTDVLESSNNWAVSGLKSATGMPLLANDMHLGLSIPGIWYQMHQVVAGKINVTGLLLPGAPVIICGHNDSIAWGMTNTTVDNLDFYEEKVNPADSGQYEHNGVWENFEVRKEVIKTKDGRQFEKQLRFSRHGAIVSSFKKIPARVISMHWAGDEMSNEFSSVMLLNRANNWNDFKNALRTFTSISQNIVYADKKGNIGLYCAAGVPIRKRDIPFGILPGHTDEYDWQGYVPFDELPYLYNPASGYVASANNRTAPAGYPYHIGSWYSLPSRYTRIADLLAARDQLTVDDFMKIQLDQHTALAEKYLPVILPVLTADTGFNETEKQALEALQGWNYDMDAKGAAPLLFETFYNQFIRCTFSDELAGLFEKFTGVSSLSRNATDQLIDAGSSPWFDDVQTTAKVENFNDVIRCAFTGAVAEISDTLGNDIRKWEWGQVHRLTLAHPLASVKILEKTLNLSRGPYPVGGSFHTVSPYSYDASQPFNVNHGSSHRHIFDLDNWDHSFTIIPTGNSGIPSSSHYCDQTEMYIHGKYHPDHFSREKVLAHARYRMNFESIPSR
jgi:penicillin amidase